MASGYHYASVHRGAEINCMLSFAMKSVLLSNLFFKSPFIAHHKSFHEQLQQIRKMLFSPLS